MTMRRITILCLSLLLAAFALQAAAQSVPFDLELGYQWLSVDGNQDMYKTQVNEQQGIILRSFSLVTNNSDKASFMDHFRIDASDIGKTPAGYFRIETGKSGAYNLRFNYHEFDMFSALPAFANPLVADGVIPGQQTWDRTRKMLDLDLELTHWQKITPFVGYSWNKNDGPGLTTYHVGQDEFRLNQSLTETSKEFRAGFGFNLGNLWGRVTQGWRSYNGDETVSLVPGAGNGNNDTPILGEPISASGISRTDNTKVDTPFTNFYASGRIGNRVTLIGNYVRFNADQDGAATESDSGSLISFPLDVYFGGLTQNISSSAKNKTWRGGARAEVRITDSIDFLAGYQKAHRELDGMGLINSIFLDSVTFAGVDLGDITTIINATNSYERDDKVFNVGFTGRAWGPFGAYVKYSQADQDVTVAQDLSEIVVSGSQGGTFSRRVKTYDIGGNYTQSGFTLLGSWKRDRADEPILRTDFLDRDRYRARAAYMMPNHKFRIGATVEKTNQSNDQTGIGYDGSMRQVAADIQFIPVETFRLYGSWSQYKADSTISYRLPQTFDLATSVQLEDGKSYEGGFTLTFPKVSFDGGLSRFDNTGTTPFTIDRYHARLTVNMFHKTGVAAEWARDKYDDSTLPVANFDADRYGLYLRWTP